MDIPIGAEVECVDGITGRSTQIILNPLTEKVTHIVVQDGFMGAERLVPIDLITEARPAIDPTADEERRTTEIDTVYAHAVYRTVAALPELHHWSGDAMALCGSGDGG